MCPPTGVADIAFISNRPATLSTTRVSNLEISYREKGYVI